MEIDQRVIQFYEEGLNLCYQGNPREGIKKFDQALKIDSGIKEIWMNKGVASSDIGDLATAEKCYDKAISLEPNYGDAWYNKAELFLRQQRFKEAIPCYDNAIKINPNDFSALYGKGTAYLNIAIMKHNKQEDNKSDLEESLASFDRALNMVARLNPRRKISLYLNRGIALHLVGREEEALKCANDVLDIDPKFSRGIYLKNLCTGQPLFQGIDDPELFRGWLEEIAKRPFAT